MRIKKLFIHACPDWDYLEIDHLCDEFASCQCQFPYHNEEAQKLKEERQDDWNRRNEIARMDSEFKFGDIS